MRGGGAAVQCVALTLPIPPATNFAPQVSPRLYSVSSMSSVTLRWPALWSRYLLGISPGMLYRSPRPGLKHSDLAIHSLITH